MQGGVVCMQVGLAGGADLGGQRVCLQESQIVSSPSSNHLENPLVILMENIFKLIRSFLNICCFHPTALELLAHPFFINAVDPRLLLCIVYFSYIQTTIPFTFHCMVI